ncbi:interference hedgehog-like isoform X2 [Babylonia areolata]|uniref:interference hedgehog-like isoform X2 n=1 Tax=Babylonia areolata TaxID=304850 RepID=UPI003FD17ECD
MSGQGGAVTMRGGALCGILLSRSEVAVSGRRPCCRAVVVVVVVVVVAVTLTGPLAAAAAAAADADGLPHFTHQPQSAVVAPHQPVTLRCQVEPPTAHVTWLFQGVPLRPAAHRGLQVQGQGRWLHFPRFRHGWREEEEGREEEGGGGNDGEYRCTATTSAGTVVSHPAVLSKPVLRSFAPSDDIVIVTYEGGYVTIPCTPPYSLPPANIRVLTETGHVMNATQGGDSSRMHVLPSGSVVLTALRTDDAGGYRCEATNPVSGLTLAATHLVRVKVMPRPSPQHGAIPGTSLVDSSTARLQVTVGQAVTLECPVAGVGVPVLTWTRGYGDLPDTASVGHFGSLHINPVELPDGGAYLCQTPGGQKRQVLLEVQRPPSVRSAPGHGRVRVQPGDDVKLTCTGGAYPAPTITWFHNGHKLRSTRRSAGEVHALHLRQVGKEDEGVYVCELSNQVGQASAVIMLTVTPHPRDEEHSQSTPITDIPSDDSVMKETREVKPSSSDNADNQHNFHLVVTNNNRHRHGRKRKKNGKRKNRKRKNKNKGRTRKAKLVPPDAPTVTRLSDTSVMVHWSVPHNDGLPISLFRIQYREVRPSSGQWQTVDDDIGAKTRHYKVSRLRAGGTYKFRMAAVYSNNDNRNSANSGRFRLTSHPYPETRPPTVTPRVVEAKAIIYKNILAIGIKWQYLPTDSSPIDGFYIFYKPYASKGDYTKEVLRGASIRNHLLTGLVPDTEYSIKMKCFNSVGASDFSNMVVKRTLPLEGQSPPTLRPPQNTAAPPGGHQEGVGLDPPVILGMVLGLMLLLLLVFIVMCWWKQRQHKRHGQNLESCMKFQDQAHRIYTDSLGKKYPNGGTCPPLSGLNGLALANGHCPSHEGVSAVSMDLTFVDPLRHPPHAANLCSGKVYLGKGVIPNGAMSAFGPSDHSDNNFNSISHTLPSPITPSPGVAPSGGGSAGSLHFDPRHWAEFPPHPYPSQSPIPALSHHHHHDDDDDDDSASQSDDVDSGDEEEPLAGESGGTALTSCPCIHNEGHVHTSRDSVVNGTYDARTWYEGSYDSMPRSAARDGEGEFPLWCADTASTSPHSGRYQRRRTRPHGEREHMMKDQATNTDLSSNEGTLDVLLNKWPGSSVSNRSNSSATLTPAEPCVTLTHPRTLTSDLAPPVGFVAPSVGLQPAVSL